MMLPEGDYQAVAIPQTTETGDTTYAQFGLSTSQKPYVALSFEITAGECKGQRIQWLGYLSPASTKRTVEALRTCGFRGDDLMAATIQELKTPVAIVIAHEEYLGRVSAKVKWINRPRDGIKVKAMNANDLRRLAAGLKAAVKDVPEIEARKPSTAAPSASADPSDEVLF